MAKSYVSQTQLEHLLAFMENNPSLAKNYSPKSTQGRYELSSLWKKLTAELNSLGFPNKSVKEWRRYWTEYKYRSKKKFSENILSKNKTGGGPAEEVLLDQMEERVVSLARIKNAVCGNGGNSFGAISKRPYPVEVENANKKIPYSVEIQKSNKRLNFIENEYATNKRRDSVENDYECFEFLDEDLLVCEPPELNDSYKDSIPSPPDCPLPPKRRNYSSEQLTNTLLQQQLNNDEKFQTEVLKLLKERNKQDLEFQTKIIELFQEKNSIEKQKVQIYKFDDLQ